MHLTIYVTTKYIDVDINIFVHTRSFKKSFFCFYKVLVFRDSDMN